MCLSFGFQREEMLNVHQWFQFYQYLNGISIYDSTTLKGKRKQLSTEESNQSRFVTKMRWVLKAVHGMLKQKYRLLDHKIDNKLVPNIGIYFSGIIS